MSVFVFDSQRYAIANAGQTRRMQPLDPATPSFEVRVVGWYHSSVIVEAVAGTPPEMVRFACTQKDFTPSSYVASAGWFVFLSLPSQLTGTRADHTSRYPHACPRCGGAAYVGAAPAAVDCLRGCRF